jgi:hypothetical protein
MTWLLILFGMAGPVIVGEFASEEACNNGGVDYLAMLMHEHGDDPLYRVPAIGCVGGPDDLPRAADGQHI